MTGKGRVQAIPGLVLVNHQRRHVVRTRAVLAFAQVLRRRLRLGQRSFNICLVDDDAIRRLNLRYRGKNKATDVLSFQWNESGFKRAKRTVRRRGSADQVGTRNFIGEIVISVPAALRNAGEEGHSTLNEIRWLVIHGVLHLLGYDHESDSGAMTRLELALREDLGVAGGLMRKRRPGRCIAKRKD